MSTVKYDKLWREGKRELSDIVDEDVEFSSKRVIKNRELAYRTLASLYIRYILCTNKLNICYDQLIHPDKRRTVKGLYEKSLARLLELKHQLIETDLSDFSFLDGVLLEMKLTRFDLDIQVPRYYRLDRMEEIKNMNSNIDEILEALEQPPTTESAAEENDEENMGDKEKTEEETEQFVPRRRRRQKREQDEEEEASKEKVNPFRPQPFKVKVETEEEKQFKAIIRTLQRHERARKARLAVQALREQRHLREILISGVYSPPPKTLIEKATLKIQRFWREYCQRHREWCRNNRVRQLIGELTPSWSSHEAEARAEQIEEDRRVRQRATAAEYDRAVEDTTAFLRRHDKITMLSVFNELIVFAERWLFTVGELPAMPEPDKILPPENLLGIPKGVPKEFAEAHFTLVPSTFPGLPPNMLGGSALIVAGFWIEPELYLLAYEAAKRAKAKGKGTEKKLSPQELKEKKQEEKEKRLKEKEDRKRELEERKKIGFVPAETALLDPLKADFEVSRVQWQPLVDAEVNENPQEKHRADLLTDQVAYERRMELRELCDELMRIELERLQIELDKLQRKKRKGKKKKKKKKGKKGKKGKDPTKDRTVESLFEELVETGIIKKYNTEASVDDFFGEPLWNGYELQRTPWFLDPVYGLGDVRQLVKEFCVLGLGSAYVHKNAPLVRSVLFLGGADSMHRQLVDAVCNEAGAVMFDLTAANIVGKYAGKKQINFLMHLVSKMSRILQPAVVFIEGGEKPFYKKVPKPEKATNPKALAKVLPKFVKAIGADDRVLLLATAEQPWLAKARPMTKLFNKIIMLPAPDYSTSVQYWHQKLMSYHGVDRDFPCSCLVECAVGYPLPTIDRVIQQVLTPRRVIQLKYRPLQPMEIMDVLVHEKQITEDESDKMLNWYRKNYPLAKKRSVKLEEEAEERRKLAELEAKKKKNQKKK